VSNVAPFQLGAVTVALDAPLFLVAGPCVIETGEHALMLAQRLAEIATEAGIGLVYKSSFDKANRSSISSYRGPGLDKGCEILAKVKERTGLAVLTDIHEPDHAARAAAYGIDCLQIPAFLCRQTDLLVAAGKSGKAVNIKKGQFLAPGAMAHAIEKVRETGNDRVTVTERGTSFGYGLVNDMTAIPQLARLGVSVIFDGTHSVQQPPQSGESKTTGGAREMIPVLVRAAVAAGCHGLFLEVHEEPSRAPSDGSNMLPIGQLAGLLRQATRIAALVREG